MPLHGPRGELQCICNFRITQANEESQLHDIRFHGILGRELIECLMHGQQSLVAFRRHQQEIVRINPLEGTSVPTR